MEGVTILAEKAVNMTPSFVLIAMTIFGLLSTFFSIIMTCVSSEKEEILPGCVSIGLAVISAILIICVSDIMNTFSHYEYKVIIDDNVSMNEFIEKYEIIDTEGLIYTVIERE